MVEERRRRELTDAELDAALMDAVNARPSPGFITRVREQLADEAMSVARPFPFVAATVALAVAAVVLVIVMLERRPVAEQPRVLVALANSPNRAVEPSAAPSASQSTRPQRAFEGTGSRPTRSQGRPPAARRRQSPSSDVLIPIAEQLALRRLFSRPPGAVLRLAPSAGDDPVAVSAIAIPPLTIDPLLQPVDEGGHQ
jgi:hypothetical protein